MPVESVVRVSGMSGRQRRGQMFVNPEDDPREGGPTVGDERTMLVDLLRRQWLTLELKCAGLAAELGYRAVTPSGELRSRSQLVLWIGART